MLPAKKKPTILLKTAKVLPRALAQRMAQKTLTQHPNQAQRLEAILKAKLRHRQKAAKALTLQMPALPKLEPMAMRFPTTHQMATMMNQSLFPMAISKHLM